jgi:hypothetical protein
MKTRIGILLGVLLLLVSCVSSGVDYSAPRAQVRFLENDSGQFCSSVVVAPGVLVTAGHCAKMSVDTPLAIAGKPIKVLRFEDSWSNDLAVAHADVACPCAKLAAEPARQDEPVIIVGFPMNPDVKAQTVHPALAQGLSPHGTRVVTVGSAPGNSGGGMFVFRDGEWQLAGILVHGLRGAQISFAMDLPALKEFLAQPQ